MACDNCNNTIKTATMGTLKVCPDCADRIGHERVMSLNKLRAKAARTDGDGYLYDLELRPDDYVAQISRGLDKAGDIVWNYHVICWDTSVAGMPENRHLLGMGMNYITVSSAPHQLDALCAALDAVRGHQERRKNATPEDKAEAESWRRMGPMLTIRV